MSYNMQYPYTDCVYLETVSTIDTYAQFMEESLHELQYLESLAMERKANEREADAHDAVSRLSNKVDAMKIRGNL